MSNENNFSLFFTLQKVDENKRLVYGRATQEVPDGVREIMDYEKSKPLFQKWSEAAQARTAAAVEAFGKEAQSLGNVRVQHTGEIGGKVIDIHFNDAEKAIDIGTFCGNDDAWDKIKKGMLTGFSVGGSYADRWRDGSYTRYVANPNEISYVDSPAVPTAMYTLIKSDGTQELRKAVSTKGGPDILFNKEDLAERARQFLDGVDITTPGTEEDTEPLPADTAQGGNVTETVPVMAGMPLAQTPELQGVAEVDLAMKFLDGMAKYQAMQEQNKERENLLKSYGLRVGIVRREGEPLTPPTDYPDALAKYGDPANLSYLVDEARLSTSVSRYNGGGDLQKYQPREWMILGRRIARMAGEVSGAPYEFDPAQKKVIRKGNTMNSIALKKGTDVGALLGEVNAALIAAQDEIGRDPAKVKDLLLQAVAAIDVAKDHTPVDVAASNPEMPVSATIATMKADGMATATPSMGATFENAAPLSTASAIDSATIPSMSTPSGSTPANMTPPPDRTMTPKESETETETYKVLKAILDKLSGPAPVAKADGIPVPAGDLAALVSGNGQPDEFKKALLEGDLRKASELAGGDWEVQARVGTLVDDEIKSIFGMDGKAPIYAG